MLFLAIGGCGPRGTALWLWTCGARAVAAAVDERRDVDAAAPCPCGEVAVPLAAFDNDVDVPSPVEGGSAVASVRPGHGVTRLRPLSSRHVGIVVAELTVFVAALPSRSFEAAAYLRDLQKPQTRECMFVWVRAVLFA